MSGLYTRHSRWQQSLAPLLAAVCVSRDEKDVECAWEKGALCVGGKKGGEEEGW